jgi:hypothetical protein
VTEPRRHLAIAEDGPLAGDPHLRVDDHDSEGRWPSPVVWSTGPDQRHVYVLSHISVSSTTGGVPTYRFERTLRADDPDPPEGWATPQS